MRSIALGTKRRSRKEDLSGPSGAEVLSGGMGAARVQGGLSSGWGMGEPGWLVPITMMQDSLETHVFPPVT